MWLDVSGNSMLPTLRSPAKVLVAGAPSPRRGDVWAFVDHNGSIVVHRYLRRRRDGSLVFRGDGLPHEDWSVRSHQLVGRVLRVEDTQGDRPVGTRYLPVARSFTSATARRAKRLFVRSRK